MHMPVTGVLCDGYEASADQDQCVETSQPSTAAAIASARGTARMSGAWRSLLSKNMQELRLILDQASPASAGVRYVCAGRWEEGRAVKAAGHEGRKRAGWLLRVRTVDDAC